MWTELKTCNVFHHLKLLEESQLLIGKLPQVKEKIKELYSILKMRVILQITISLLLEELIYRSRKEHSKKELLMTSGVLLSKVV